MDKIFDYINHAYDYILMAFEHIQVSWAYVKDNKWSFIIGLAIFIFIITTPSRWRYRKELREYAQSRGYLGV